MTVDYTTGEIVAPLSALELSALTHAEAKIERGLATFIEVGEALCEVRDSQLYREEFSTFEAYCRDRWNITDRRARQMIDAAKIATSLPTGSMLPVNERQAAELRGLEPSRAAGVIREAHEATGGNLTAAAIREARGPQDAPAVTPNRARPRPVAERSLNSIALYAGKASREAQTLTADQIRRVRPEAGHWTTNLRDSIEALQRLVNSLDTQENQ